MSANKVWIFPSNKRLTEQQKNTIEGQMTTFLSQWQAHGKDLNSKFEIKYDYFLIVQVDPELQKATGCSIDSLMNCITGIAKQLNIDFWDRWSMYYLSANDQVKTIHVNQIQQRIKDGEINLQTVVFDNTLTEFSDISQYWQLPLEHSLYSRFI